MDTCTSTSALVVYESMFGNTAEIASAVAGGLELEGIETLLVEVSNAPSRLVAGLGLLVVGAPTHAFSLSRPSTRADAVRQGAPAARAEIGLREWLTSVGLPSPPPAVAVFDTRVAKVRHVPMAASRAAAKLARHRGMRLLVDPADFLVDDTGGPLLPDELEKAREWARALARACRGKAYVRPA
jgi:hypothetical protein